MNVGGNADAATDRRRAPPRDRRPSRSCTGRRTWIRSVHAAWTPQRPQPAPPAGRSKPLTHTKVETMHIDGDELAKRLNSVSAKLAERNGTVAPELARDVQRFLPADDEWYMRLTENGRRVLDVARLQDVDVG